jgi:hypothetical protein
VQREINYLTIKSSIMSFSFLVNIKGEEPQYTTSLTIIDDAIILDYDTISIDSLISVEVTTYNEEGEAITDTHNENPQQ